MKLSKRRYKPLKIRNSKNSSWLRDALGIRPSLLALLVLTVLLALCYGGWTIYGEPQSKKVPTVTDLDLPQGEDPQNDTGKENTNSQQAADNGGTGQARDEGSSAKSPDSPAGKPSSPSGESIATTAQGTVTNPLPTSNNVAGGTSTSHPLALSEKLPLVTIPSVDFREMVEGWLIVTDTTQEETKFPSVHIRNLRETYADMLMKPVCMEKDGSVIDLTTGQPLQNGEASLIQPTGMFDPSVYLHVDQPLRQWGSVLRQWGIAEGQISEIRYYLLPVVKNALNRRAGLAIKWLRQEGKLEEGIDPSTLVLVGDAIPFTDGSNGRIAVFVPKQVRRGKEVLVEIPVQQALANEKDIKVLAKAGLI